FRLAGGLVEQALLALARHDGIAALAALHQGLVRAKVEARFLDVAAVTDKALLDEDRLDILVVADRLLALDLDDLDRLGAGGRLLLAQGGQGQSEKEWKSKAGVHRVGSPAGEW